MTTWYTSVQRYVGDMSKALAMSIMQVDTDFGMVNFVLERYVATGNATGSVGGISFSFPTAGGAEGYLIHLPFLKKAWLTTPQIYRQAMTGDNLPGMVFQEWTIECRNNAAFGKFSAGTSVVFP